jgi:hypothetical protein
LLDFIDYNNFTLKKHTHTRFPMGQGTESCGGYEIHHDPVADGLEHGLWQTRDGGETRISTMSKQHLRNAIRHARNRSQSTSFSCDSETWDEWVETLENELETRPHQVKTAKENQAGEKITKTTRPAKQSTRGAKQSMKCHCGTVYDARKADLKRGWALSCNKACAGIRRECGKPAATKVTNSLENS